MLQGWNKFCLTGGIVEFSAKLPGDPQTGGLWPALWMLGNLARATYVGSSNYIWPYSYNQCDPKNRHSQQISACSKVGHYGMKPGVGRGSPEIDALEALMGGPEKLPNTNVTRPYFSTSLQIAPGLEGSRPVLGKLPKEVGLAGRSHVAAVIVIINHVFTLDLEFFHHHLSGTLVSRARVRKSNAVESIFLRSDSRTRTKTINLPI